MTSPASGMPSQATLYPQKLSSKSISTPPFAMYVKLPADVLQAIKSSNGSGLKLSLGPKMVNIYPFHFLTPIILTQLFI